MGRIPVEKLSQNQQQELVTILAARFSKYTSRHPEVNWEDVEQRLKAHPEKLTILQKMEQSGGEPDVIGTVDSSGAYIFVDCSIESPNGRRSLCYDRKALDSRKANKPQSSVMDMVAMLGSQLLDEEEYRQLQQVGEFDNKTSSWVSTPAEIRGKGGALFCDRRYGNVFTYHNGADSYYAARGFRTLLRV